MANPTTKRLLHVEDDSMQQRLLAHHLKALQEFHFERTTVSSEDEAMTVFRAGRFDIVIVDYQLTQGNGLHLLLRLRQLDPVIPIIAISGVATSEVAADLVRAGADDYFDKRDLTSAKLAQSIRDCLRRADTVRRRRPSLGDARGPLVDHLVQLCDYFSQRVGIELAHRLEAFALEARLADMRAGDIEELYRSACQRFQCEGRTASLPVEVVLRPLMLDLLVRVLGDAANNALEEIVVGPPT